MCFVLSCAMHVEGAQQPVLGLLLPEGPGSAIEQVFVEGARA
jgi:hypothetical protein